MPPAPITKISLLFYVVIFLTVAIGVATGWTGDKTCVSHITSKSRQQIMEWKPTYSPDNLKAEHPLSQRNIMASVFGNKHGVFLVDFMLGRNHYQWRSILPNPHKAPESDEKKNKKLACWQRKLSFFITIENRQCKHLKVFQPFSLKNKFINHCFYFNSENLLFHCYCDVPRQFPACETELMTQGTL